VRHQVVSVEAQEPVSLAVDRLVASHHRHLVVLEDGWPAGVFGQREALAARSARASSPVDHWMSPAYLSERPDTPAHRVAARASATRAHCVLVADGPRLEGVVTGMDFARLVAREPSRADASRPAH
jgi:CBS domain-containing protein